MLGGEELLHIDKMVPLANDGGILRFQFILCRTRATSGIMQRMNTRISCLSVSKIKDHRSGVSAVVGKFNGVSSLNSYHYGVDQAGGGTERPMRCR